MKSKKILTTLAVSAMLLTGCSFCPKDTIVKVNNQCITQKQFDQEMDQVAGNSMFAQMGVDVKKDKKSFLYLMMKDKIVNELIVKSLVNQEMDKRKITVSKDETDKALKDMIDKIGSKEKFNELLKQNGITADKFQKDLQEDVKMKKLVASISKVNVSESDAKAFYNKNLDKFQTPDKVRASHILISANPDEIKAKIMSDPANKALSPSEVNDKVQLELNTQKAKAEQLLAMVKKNPSEFAKVARENSDDTTSAQKGGDLGFFARNEMVAPFAKAAFAQRPNTISGLVQSQYGYHIIMVKDRMKAGKAPFEKVKPEIMAYLQNQAQVKVLDKLIESLKKQAKIEYINPEYNPATIQKELKAASKKQQAAKPSAQPAPAAAQK